MSSLAQKAFTGLAILFAVTASLLFGAAGTFHYWQAWLFLVAYFAPSLAIILYLIKEDPALLARRMSGGPFAEKEPVQKIIMSIVSLGFVGLIVLPALDHRVGWSPLSPTMVLIGDLLVLTGWLGIFLVFRENSFGAATIELSEDQSHLDRSVCMGQAPDVCCGSADAVRHSPRARLGMVGAPRARIVSGAGMAAQG